MARVLGVQEFVSLTRCRRRANARMLLGKERATDDRACLLLFSCVHHLYFSARRTFQ